MAWGLEARVPFLDKEFLDVAMGIDPRSKMFSKGVDQETDDDGCPVMEKVRLIYRAMDPIEVSYDIVHTTQGL